MALAGAIGAGGVAAGVVVGMSSRGSARDTTVETVPFASADPTVLSTSAPPWPLPSDARIDIAAAGIAGAGRETTTVHYHAHLDVIVDSTAVAVPAGVGFVIENGRATGITALHTHDTSGIIHIESPTGATYTVGQFFTEWGVRLGPGRIGGLVTGPDGVLRVFVDGRRFSGNPAEIVLKAHQEIALWYGSPTATSNVPAGYRFPAGD